jgi:hypothetical protein
MAKAKESQATYSTLDPTVEELATAIRSLSRDQIAHLVSLVPDLKIAQSRRAVLDRMRQRIRVHKQTTSLPPSGQFIGGLTLDQYLALSDRERDQIWGRLFSQVEQETKHRGHPIKRDALPAGQKRRTTRR